MIRIDLINMPFADVKIPSIAITQLQSVILESLGDEVKVDLKYFNNEIATYLGKDVYEFIAMGAASNNTGFGDWFFRQQAFPFLADNTVEFFERYGSHFGKDNLLFYENVIKEKREGLGVFMDKLIYENSLHESNIVGFTSMFMQNVSSFALARRIKSLNPKSTIVIGGANCESPMGEEIVKNLEFIDYVFSGTALKSFPQFVRNYINSETDKSESINGVFTKKNFLPQTHKEDVSLVGNSKKISPIGDELGIDETVELNYESFLNDFERSFSNDDITPRLLFETSRGCWWGAKAHCTFCGLNGGNMFYRAMKPDRAIALFNTLFDKYASRVNYFSSVDNIIPKEYFKDVFPKLNVPDSIKIFYEVKADLQEDEMQILSKARIVDLQPGIESLATSTLKLMKKGITSFNNIRFLKNCIQYGISPAWNLLIGFPGELEEVYIKYIKDIPLLVHLPPPSGTFPVRFDRYSPYFVKAKEYKLDLRPLDYYKFIYPFSDEVNSNLAYYFGDINYEADYIKVTSFWIKKIKDQVDKWASLWENPDVAPQPYLFLENSGTDYYIYDSRSGEQIQYSVSNIGVKILASLATHKGKAGLCDDLRPLPSELVERELEFLMNKGLIFEERGGMISLVFENSKFCKKEEMQKLTQTENQIFI